MYLTYEEYQSMGGTLTETAFNDFEFEARAQVDWYTFNRLQKETEYPEAVKRCMYKIISYLYQLQQAQAMPTEAGSEAGGIAASISSQSNDGVSVSYNTLSAKDMMDASKNEIQDCIEKYLQGVKNSLGQRLLYRGIYPNE